MGWGMLVIMRMLIGLKELNKNIFVAFSFVILCQTFTMTAHAQGDQETEHTPDDEEDDDSSESSGVAPSGSDSSGGDDGNDALTPVDVHGQSSTLGGWGSSSSFPRIFPVPIDDYDDAFEQNSPDEDHEGEDTCAKDGNPVVLSSGNKIESETDFKANGGVPLTFRRIYNAQSYFRGSFGTKWRSSFDYHLGFQFASTPYYCNFSYDPAPGSSCDPTSQYVEAVASIEPGGGRISYSPIESSPNVYVDKKANSISYIEKDGNQWVHVTEALDRRIYDEMGVLLKIEDRFGRYIEFEYDVNQELESIESDTGVRLEFTWQNGRISSVKDPDGFTYSYTYNSNGMLASVAYPGGAGGRAYHYENSGSPQQLTGISVNGVRYSTFSYYSSGKVSQTKHANDQDEHNFSYGALGDGRRYTDVEGPGGATTRYVFDEVNESMKLVETSRSGVSNCPNAASVVAYDANGFMDYRVDWRGVKTDYDYNDAGQLLQVQTGIDTVNSGQSVPRITVYEWTEDNRIDKFTVYGSSLSDPVRQIDYVYYSSTSAERGRLKQRRVKDLTSFGGGVEQITEYFYSFHSGGLQPSLITIDGSLPGSGDRQYYKFDSSGYLSWRRLGSAGPDEIKTTFANYTGLGRARTITDPNGHVVTRTFDARGRQIGFEETVEGTLASYIYALDGFGNLESATVNGDPVITRTIGPSGLVGSEYLGSDATQKKFYEYNSFGQVTKYETSQVQYVRDPNCPPLAPGEPGWCPRIPTTVFTPHAEYGYDEIGRLTDVYGTGSQHFQYRYDNNGNMIEMIDSYGHSTTLEYNAQNELIKRIDRNGSVTEFDYDEAGNLDWVKDPNLNVTTYTYDGLDRLRVVDSPDTGVTEYHYDQYGRMDEMVRADGAATTYAYDSLGRLLSTTASGDVESHSYDTCTNGIGRLCSSANSATSESYTYKAYGPMDSRTTIIGGVSYVTTFGYDFRRRPIETGYPGGNTVRRQYDDRSYVTAVEAKIAGTWKDVVTNITYLPYGPIKSWKYGNLAYESRAYDDDYRLLAMGSSGIQSLDYGYDWNNRLRSIDNGINSNWSQTYFYDDEGRLTTANSSGLGNQGWTFDANGNRETHIWSGATDDYQPSTINNQIPTITGGRAKSFTYDLLGNITDKSGYGGAWSATYDPYNRMNSFTTGGQATTYAYNPSRMRVTKTSGGTTTRYLYLDGARLLGEGSGSSLTTQYIWLGGKPIGLVKGSTLYFVHTDHLGRPDTVADQNKTVVWRAANTAYKRTVTTNSIGGLNVGFPGQYYDGESGLYYNWHRYYDPATGQYLQSDPIGLGGGLNTYGYVGGNPVNFVDPLGLELWGWGNEMYMRNYYRNGLNVVPPSKAAAQVAGWTQMSPARSALHQQGPFGKDNTKWVDDSGQCEAVYDKSGSLVTDTLNGGTYNYASPYTDPIGHVMLDVIPYLLWGNGPITVDMSGTGGGR